ncbi:hypothetical protein ACLMJK_005222 [Lecanora helva]
MSSTHLPEPKDSPRGEGSPARSSSDETVVEEAKEQGEAKEKSNVHNTDAVPNGGLNAWLQVAGSFFLAFNTWGIINTYGAYQTYYESGDLFTKSSSDLSWIGSIQAFLLLLVGALTGPIYDAGYFRALIIIGSFAIVFGHMMLSLVHEFWQALLAQAFVVGLGAGSLFIPSVAILPTYFTTKIPIAIGIAASGSSVGGIIYPIVFERLQDEIGFPWATRVLSFLMLATLMVPIAFMRPRVLPPAKRKLFEFSAFRNPAYVLFVIGVTVGFMGLYVPFFYIQYYADVRHMTSGNLSSYLLAILNAGSVFGRIAPNFFAQKIGPINMLIPCVVLTSILTFTLIRVHNEGGIITFSLIYGFFSGTFVSLPPTVFVFLSLDNRALIGTRMGMGFAIASCGALAGTPIAGAILNNHGFNATWCFSGGLVIGAAALMTAARFFKDKTLMAKV